MKEKTYVEDVDRSMYDFRNEDKDAYKVKEGLNPEIVEQISSEKHDPEWMKEFRMKSLEIFNNSTMPDEWGPSIEGLDMDNIELMFVQTLIWQQSGQRFRKKLRILLKSLVSRRQSVSLWLVLVLSTTLSLFITM